MAETREPTPVQKSELFAITSALHAAYYSADFESFCGFIVRFDVLFLSDKTMKIVKRILAGGNSKNFEDKDFDFLIYAQWACSKVFPMYSAWPGREAMERDISNGFEKWHQEENARRKHKKQEAQEWERQERERKHREG